MFTDNNPLVHLDTARLCVMEQHWVAQLANFTFDLKYLPGTINQNADVLSRLPGEREVQAAFAQVEPVEEEAVEFPWKNWQWQDPAIQTVRT